MKRIFFGVTTLLLLAGNANALNYTFSYGSHYWGTMAVEQVDINTLSIRYDASDSVPAGSQATGFGFAPDLGSFSISNPQNHEFDWDQDDLSWMPLTNLNAIPNPANSTEITKKSFLLGATEGKSNNLNPPGIGKGQQDIFYLDFQNATNLSELTLVGVRLQSLPETINGGSLFLVGTLDNQTPDTAPVAEPATLLLFGTGLAGLAGINRRRKK